MAEKFQKLIRDLKSYIQQFLQTPSKINTKKLYLEKHISKTAENQGQIENLKSNQRKIYIIFKGVLLR